MATRTNWTDKRLERLFARYNFRYWEGKLPSYSVRVDSTYKGCYCEKRTRTITMNVESLRSYREIRGVLLHEMAHAAVRVVGHGAIWQAEMERLKAAGAPTCAVDYVPGARLPSAFLVRQFADAAQEPGARWRTVLRQLGYEYGHTDSRGRPRDAHAARFITRAHEAYKRARREYLKNFSIIDHFRQRKG